MNRKTLSVMILMLMVMALLLYVLILPFTQKKKLTVNDGLADLTNFNFSSQTVSLDGRWEFYWNALLDPVDFKNGNSSEHFSGFMEIPDSWSNYDVPGTEKGVGYATYRAVLQTKGQAGRLFGLRMPTVSTAYKLFVDGKELTEVGKVGKTAETSKSAFKPGSVYFVTNSDYTEIVIQVSNYDYSSGGLWMPLEFGLYDQVVSADQIYVRLEMFIIGLLACALLQNIMYFVNNGYSAVITFNMIICLLYLSRMLFTGEYYITRLISNIPFPVIIYSTYLMTLLIPVFAMLFSRGLHKKAFSKRAVNGIVILAVLILVAEAFIPTRTLTAYINAEMAICEMILIYCAVKICIEYVLRSSNIETITLALLLFLYIDLFAMWSINAKYIVNSNMAIFFTVIMIYAVQTCLIALKYLKALYKAKKYYKKTEFLVDTKNMFIEHTYQELSSPLMGLISVTDSALSKVDPSQEKLLGDLQLIQLMEHSLNRTVSEVFDYSKYQDFSVTLDRRKFDMLPLVEYALHEIDWIANEKKMTIETKFEANKVIIEADEYKLIKMITLLFESAIEISESSGKLNVALSMSKFNVYMSLTFDCSRETGETLEEILNTKQDLIARGTLQGSYLGFAISKEIAQVHDGRLDLELLGNKGVKMMLTIPTGESPELFKSHIENPRRLELTGTASEVVTIIDGNYFNMSGTAYYLNNKGLTVKGFTDPSEGLEYILGVRDTDIAIIDLILPTITGYKIVEIIREQYSMTDLPILITASKVFEDHIAEGLAIGANEMIFEPYAQEELYARINTLKTVKESTDQAVNSEIAMMQAQINPHFLHNVLNTLAAFIVTEAEPEKAGTAYDIITHLSAYLRLSYGRGSARKMIRLDDEVELTRNYLSLEKLRYREKIDFNIDFEETSGVMVPPLIIQPLVENSVQHGISVKPEGGWVTACGRKEGKRYRIAIEDNGVGMSEDAEAQITGKKPAETIGIGVRNVIQRVKRTYGTDVEIISEPGVGTKIQFYINL